MVLIVSFQNIHEILSSWEIARQQRSSPELLGTEFLLRLFEANPETMRLFGLKGSHNRTKSPMLQMGVLVHAQLLIERFSEILSMVGPDLEDLDEIICDLRVTCRKNEVTADVLDQVVLTICHTLSDCLGDKWNPETELAWNNFLTKVSAAVLKPNM